jgi:hypothetical protein
MSDVVVARESTAPVDRLWQVVTDWAGHARFFPLTTVRVESAEDGSDAALGVRLQATTRFGPVHFQDPMIVTRWDPPGERGRCELRKVGRVLGGRTVLEVEPVGNGSRLRWTTDVGPAPERLRRLVGPVAKVSAIPLYRHVVRGMVREAERG